MLPRSRADTPRRSGGRCRRDWPARRCSGPSGTPLFPRSPGDLDMRCSCPDWEVPCKHLAAVCYVLAEEFDRDPFAMLAWRGRGRGPAAHSAAPDPAPRARAAPHAVTAPTRRDRRRGPLRSGIPARGAFLCESGHRYPAARLFCGLSRVPGLGSGSGWRSRPSECGPAAWYRAIILPTGEGAHETRVSSRMIVSAVRCQLIPLPIGLGAEVVCAMVL